MSTQVPQTDERTATELPRDHLQEMARIDRLLRADGRTLDVEVHVGRSGAKIYFTTGRLNEHARGSLTASVANEVVATDAWGLATIHDPIEDVEEGATQSLLSIVYDKTGGE